MRGGALRNGTAQSILPSATTMFAADAFRAQVWQVFEHSHRLERSSDRCAVTALWRQVAVISANGETRLARIDP